MNTDTVIKLGRTIKALFLKWKFYLLIEPLSDFILKFLYLSRMSKWCSDQGIPPFNDLDNPGYQSDKRYSLYAFVLEHEHLDGPIEYLEFGVAGGDSLKWWVENNTHASSRFVGFDTFEGLPEKFEWLEKGTFSSGGKTPDIRDSRCMFEVGMFQNTLDPFLLKAPSGGRTVIHLDADLYSSTLYVLSRLGPRLKKNDIILFDEFGVPMHEFRAFIDFAQAFRINYALVGTVSNYMNVAMRIM